MYEEYDVVIYQHDTWLNKVKSRDEGTNEGFIKTFYAYNGSNERMWKQVQQLDAFLHTTKTVYFHGDNPWPLVERQTYQKQNTTGTVTYQTQSSVKWHIYGKNGIIATHTNAESIEFPLKDHLGSPRVVLKQTITQGGVSGLSQSGSYAWHPFGGLLESYGDAEPDYGFTGQEKDHESGLHNFRARAYHEQLGRFFAVDPQGQFHSPYVYAGNNPFMGTDPDGEFFFSLAAVITGQWHLLPVTIGVDLGMWQGGRMANGGEWNPTKWNWESGKTWGYVTAGGVTGGVTGGVGNSIAQSGTAFAYTKAMMASSYINSIMTNAYTGGETPISITLPFASVSFGKDGVQIGYLGKKGNSLMQNIGHGLSGMTPISDYVDLQATENLKNRNWDYGKDFTKEQLQAYADAAWHGNYLGPGDMPEIDPQILLDNGIMPKDAVDLFSFDHDQYYYNNGVGGKIGAVFSRKVQNADFTLGYKSLGAIIGGKKANFWSYIWTPGAGVAFTGIATYKIALQNIYYSSLVFR